ncbi:hypothetical protein JCM8097_002523 [Rhodosporidiobolus ruineniae]
MIPARAPATPSAPPESVTERLRRLRIAQQERAPTTASSPTAQSGAPRWLSAALSPSRPLPVPRRAYGRRGLAGPAPPPSWTAPAATAAPTEAVDGRNQQGTWTQPVQLVERRKLAVPLSRKAAEKKAGAPTLFQVAGGVVAQDLAAGDQSLLLEHVAWLPNHLRMRLLDVFSDWRNAAPLTSEGAVELLRTDISEGVEQDEDGAEVVRQEEEEDDWENAARGDEAALTSLESLDFSFSAVSTRALRSVLLRPVASTSTASSRSNTPSTPTSSIPRAPKLVPTFPLLRTLNLTSTPRIPFTSAFFELLSSLISLRHLSLCGKSLDQPSSAVTSSTFLPLLSASTPTLHTLDLSYVDGLAHVAVKAVDWDVRWRELRQLGMRRELVDWKGEPVGPEKKERIKREVWHLISQGRQKTRRWIEIII